MQRILILLVLIMISSTQAQTAAESYDLKEFKDLAYLPAQEIEVDSLQRLNLVMPGGVANPPLFLWIGGGAWSFVNRDMEMDLARQFAKAGIAVASVGHRLSKGRFQTPDRESGVIHPAHIEDIAAAFHFLYKNADKYGYDNKSIVVGGFSSGAHLAALLAMDKKYLAAYGLSPEHISAIIPVGGTYDINHYYLQFKNNPDKQTQALAETHVMDVFGRDLSGYEAASPASFLSTASTPMLLISDNALRIYTDEFIKRLEASAYSNYVVHHVTELNHGELWRDLSYEAESETRQLMISYIREL